MIAKRSITIQSAVCQARPPWIEVIVLKQFSRTKSQLENVGLTNGPRGLKAKVQCSR